MNLFRYCIILAVALMVVNCRPKPTPTSSMSLPPPPATVTIAKVDPKDLDKAMACLGRNHITASTESNGPKQPGVIVDQDDAAVAIKVLAEDSKEKGYKLYNFNSPHAGN